MRFHIVLIRPLGHRHAEAFREMIELVRDGLAALGYRVTTAENRWDANAVNIFFGAHHLANARFPEDRLPPRGIIYNLEPLRSGTFWDRPNVVSWFAHYPVWDYSHANATYRTRHQWPGHWYTLPVGYMPSWTRIRRSDPPDRDALFYGSLSLRRRGVLEAVQHQGMLVQTLFGVYGAERDAWIARSRLVLNLHQTEAAPFEVVRVAYLLANHCAVVAEGDPHKEVDAMPWAQGIAWTTYSDFASTCQQWLMDAPARERLADQGFNLIAQRSEAQYLQQVLDQMAADRVL